MEIALHIFLILISFAIAFLGIIVLFTFDTQVVFLLALGGIILSLRVMNRT